MRRAAALAALAVAASLSAPARAADCPQLQCTPAHAGTAPASIGAADAARLGPAWRFVTGARVHGALSLAGGTLFVASEDHHVYAVDAATGNQRWAFRTGGPVWSTPAVVDGVAYFGSSDGNVYAVDARSGAERWRMRTGADVVSSPAVAGGLVFVGGNDHAIYAISARTGKVRWSVRTGDRVSGSPAVADGTVYIGSNDHRLYALDAGTGRTRWTATADAWVWSPPAVAGGRVFFLSNGTTGSPVSNGSGGHLYALDAASGRQLWVSAASLSSFGAPVVDGSTVIASGFTATEAHDVATGAVRWSHAAKGSIFTSPFVAGGLVYEVDSLTDGTGFLDVLDTGTGTVVKQVGFGRLDSVYGAPLVADGRVYFGGGDGTVHALAPGATADVEHRAAPRAVPLLPYSAHRDVLADMLDPDSVTELRAPGDGVARVAVSGDPRDQNLDLTIFHGIQDGRKVLMDVHGAGVMTDQFMYLNAAAAPTGDLPPALCPPDPGNTIGPKIALYVDDRLVYDINAVDFYCGRAGFPFVEPLTGVRGATQFSHVPVPFRRHLQILADPAFTQNNLYYDFFYTLFGDDRGVQSFDPARDRARYQQLIDRWKAAGSDPHGSPPGTRHITGNLELKPGQTAKLLDTAEAGEVTSIRFRQFTSNPPVQTRPDAREGEPLRATRLRARWDDHPDLDVDAPVGDFFGTGFGQAQNYDTLVAGMHTAGGDTLPADWPHPSEASLLGKPGGVSTYSYWPMPFARHAEISLTNTLPAGGATTEVAYDITVQPRPNTRDERGRLLRGRTELGYFHAAEFHNRQKANNSPHPDRDANDAFARLRGRGNYAGQVLNMTNKTFGKGSDDLHYMEGDCMFWVDDDPDYLPGVTSTGHEECHDAAGPYFEYVANNPTGGDTSRDVCGSAIFCTTTGEASAFRYWLGDTIAFQRRLDATVEHGSENTYDGGTTETHQALADESGVAFYYLADTPAVTLPSTRTCASRRSFRIRLRIRRGLRPVSATVTVDGKRVAVRRGRRLTAPVDLRGLRRGRFTVRVAVRLRSGRVVRETRRYRTCRPRG